METKTSVRDIILKELETGQRTWSQLLDSARNSRNISQSAFYYHLTKLLRDGKIAKRVNPGGSIVYLLSKLEASEMVEKKVTKIADETEITFLLDVIRRAQTDEAVEQALNDLRNLILTQNVVKYPKLWDFFGEMLNNNRLERHWSRLIDCISLITENAEKQNDAKTVQRVRSTMLPRILDIAKTSTSARQEAIKFAVKLLRDDEKLKELKEIAERIIDQSGDLSALYPLGKLYATRKKEIWQWLYPLIESDDDKTRRRATELLEYLRSIVTTRM